MEPPIAIESDIPSYESELARVDADFRVRYADRYRTRGPSDLRRDVPSDELASVAEMLWTQLVGPRFARAHQFCVSSSRATRYHTLRAIRNGKYVEHSVDIDCDVLLFRPGAELDRALRALKLKCETR